MTIDSDKTAVLDGIKKYGESFPFPVFSLAEIQRLEANRRCKLPLLVSTAFASIGYGDHFLTGSFFILDTDGELTDALYSQFDECRSNSQRGGEFGYNYVNYDCSGCELVIATTEFTTYFIRDMSDEDPIVHCFFRDGGVVDCEIMFSELLKGFKYFNSPEAIPQKLIDWAWFERRFGLDRLTTGLEEYSRKIDEWIAMGREGMPSHLKTHPNVEVAFSTPGSDRYSVFHPDY